jgi:hypothetical protein
MPSPEILAFLVAALLAGGLSMGGVTLVYFRDKWRVDAVRGDDVTAEPESTATREAA